MVTKVVRSLSGNEAIIKVEVDLDSNEIVI